MYKINGINDTNKPDKKCPSRLLPWAFSLVVKKRTNVKHIVINIAIPYSVPIKMEIPCVMPVIKNQNLLPGWVTQKENNPRVIAAQMWRVDG